LSSLRTSWPTLASLTSDGLKIWAHEWEKHDTCAQNFFNEHGYFQAALCLRGQLRVLDAFTSAGISLNSGYYMKTAIKGTIQEGTGYEPYVDCNRDESSYY
jgi:ribonuclease T2